MILYYAVGGGLGHLTRARAVIHSLGLNRETTLLSSSPHGDDPRVLGAARHIMVPKALEADLKVYQGWLQELLEALRPQVMFLDAFPCGLLGEFCDIKLPPGLQVYHVARLLRWSRYQERLRGEPPYFEITYRVEPLTTDHDRFLRSCSSDVIDLTLEDPPSRLGSQTKKKLDELLSGGAPLWLVVHSSPEPEVNQLCSLALEEARLEDVAPHLLLVSPKMAKFYRDAGITHLPVYPATPLCPRTSRVFTACGFNAMRQGEPLGPRHVFMPFPRSLDDQHLRARRRLKGKKLKMIEATDDASIDAP